MVQLNPGQVEGYVKITARDPGAVRQALAEVQMDGILFKQEPIVLSIKRRDANLLVVVIAESKEILWAFINLIEGLGKDVVQSVSAQSRSPVPA